MRKNLLFVLAMIFATVAMISCSSSDKGETGKSGQGSGAYASAASGQTISFSAQDLEGKIHTYEEYKGQPLIINFWGTWCPPCKMEMPDIQKIYDEYNPKGLEIIGLATERRPEMAVQSVSAFIAQHGYNWVMLIANKESAQSLGLGSGVPYTLFVDKSGKIVKKHTGMMRYNDFKAEVEKII